MSIKILIKCGKCHKAVALPELMEESPSCWTDWLRIYRATGYLHTSEGDLCPDCIPDKLKPIETEHPKYYDYEDVWNPDPLHKKRSHQFADEPYQPIANIFQGHLCEECDYMRLGWEDDGSNWMMCCVEHPKESWGHNLYSGHFYGPAISGRFCPYFTNRDRGVCGRDPIADKKKGVFHVPYNHEYDGD